MKISLLSFDPSWAGAVGWAAVDWDSAKGLTQVATGDFPCPGGGRDPEVRDLSRGNALVRGYVQVLENWHIRGEPLLCYESPLTWLLAAAKRRRANPPVTKNSLNGAVMAVACFKAGAGIWYSNLTAAIRARLRVRTVPTAAARKALGVRSWAAQVPQMVRQLAQSANYDYASQKKAVVGAALALRLQHDGWPRDGSLFIPPSDHQADALVGALYWLDRMRHDALMHREEER